MMLLLMLLYVGTHWMGTENIKLSENSPTTEENLLANDESILPNDTNQQLLESPGPTAPSSKALVANVASKAERKRYTAKQKTIGPLPTLTWPIQAPQNFSFAQLVLQTALQPIQSLQPPSDPPFFDRLEHQLDRHTRHYRPEKVYLHFDRLWFQPGEAIWFNAYVLDANTLQPSLQSEIVYVELKKPNGTMSKTLKLVAKQGQTFGDFQLAADAVGGSYTVRAYTKWQKNEGHYFERNIQVRKAVLPRLSMELDFVKTAYGPGDEVEAQLELRSLDNQALAKTKVNYEAMLGGKTWLSKKAKTDELGKTKISFRLPADLKLNDGLLNIVIDHQGQRESIARSIPIVLNKIDLRFLPEGGEWLVGFRSKMAFKALNEYGKPADVSGYILNSQGQQVARFHTYHQGMGTFQMTPEAGEHYYAQITRPQKIDIDYELPKALPKRLPNPDGDRYRNGAARRSTCFGGRKVVPRYTREGPHL
ncbi:MAG: MG2 domain-containing protein [Bacteroidota bacterium]